MLATIPAEAYKKRSPLAYRVAELGTRNNNMSAFLAGRQFLTAMNMVLLSKVTSYAGADGELLPGGDWGFGRFFNTRLQTGFIGAIFVVNVAQLASQGTASIFPVAVVNNHFMYWLLVLMLFVEAAGIVNACWPLAYFIERVFDMDPDPPLVERKSAAELMGTVGQDRQNTFVSEVNLASKQAGSVVSGEDPTRPAGAYDGV